MRSDESLPRSSVITLFVIMPLLISVLMVIVAAVIGHLLGEDLPSGLIVISLSAFMLANALRTALSCIDWFETRSAERRARG